MVLAVVVASHWVLDLVTHRPDLPLTISGSDRVGLALWNYPSAAISVELLLFAAGIWIYVRQTRAVNKIGSIGLWGLTAFLLLVYLANVFGPPPPSAEVVAWSAQAMWLLVGLGFWIDRHRTARAAVVDAPS